MVKPFISMEVGNITAQVRKVTDALDQVAERAIEGAKRGLNLAAEAMLADAQGAAPVQTGRLQESGTTEEIVIEGTELVKRWGFNSEYARIRDRGGTILPVRAKLLSIPLSDKAKRMGSPLEMGDTLRLVPINGKLFLVEKVGKRVEKGKLPTFHWLLVPKVEQQGNGYVTRTVDAWKDTLPRVVSDEVGRAIAGGAL